MKKIFALLLILALALPVIALGTATPTDTDVPSDVFTVSGVVTEITDEYILIADENDQMVQVNIITGEEATVIETSKENGIALGDYIVVMYNGMMTRSLPPQVAAQKIICFEKTGVVSAITEETFTLTTDDGEEIIVNATAEQIELLVEGDRKSVYFDGVMTLSLPAQISALHISDPVEDVYTLFGTVTEVTGEYIIVMDEIFGEVQVNIAAGEEGTIIETTSEAGIALGDYVTVMYDGKMTRSLPPQVSALRITCYTMEGTVSDITEEGFMLNREGLDAVQVNAPANMMAGITDGAVVTVAFDGAMTMSLPAQISAQMILITETIVD